MSATPIRQQGTSDASRKDSVIEVMFLFLAMGPVILSAYASYITGDGQWFQRSGALMVLFSAAVEYHRRRMPQRSAGGRDQAKTDRAFTAGWVSRFWKSIPYVCYASVFIGTLIWSYGDLLF